MTSQLLTAAEVASVLGLTSARIYALSREGMLPFLVKIGDRPQYRYSAEGLRRYVENGGNTLENSQEGRQSND